ncbi:hypothetical protein LOTGIDRAFT_96295, partial [Lottia gigantea]
KRLLENKKYDTFLRPVQNQSMSVMLDLRIEVMSSLEIEEEKLAVEISLLLKFSWFDEFMMWNSSEFPNNKKLFIEREHIWYPRIVFMHQAKGEGIREIGEATWCVDSTGRVNYTFPMFSRTLCDMDILKFPFDVQSCHVMILIQNYFMEEVEFRNVEVVKHFPPGQKWKLVDGKVSKIIRGGEDRWSVADLVLVVERRSTFLVISIIVPLVTVSIMNPMVFLIPGSSGEKISVAVTGLLTYLVYINLVSEVLPKTS